MKFENCTEMDSNDLNKTPCSENLNFNEDASVDAGQSFETATQILIIKQVLKLGKRHPFGESSLFLFSVGK